jgi:hypothetical protein
MANHFQLGRLREPTRVRFQSAINLARQAVANGATLARERRVGITMMRKRLDEAGVRLAFDRKQVGARFYARDEVRKANLQ